MDRKTKIEYAVLIALLFILSVVVFIYFSPKAKTYLFGSLTSSVQVSPTPSANSTPTPRPIPHGKTGFTVSQSNKKIPQFGRGFLDPYDPGKGDTQTITIGIKHASSISSATAVLNTDNGVSQPTELKLISGTDTDGQWQASWRVVDTYLFKYKITLYAISSDGKSSSVTVTLR